MTKTVKIEGMSCKHCAMRVEKALNALGGVSAAVDLAAASATVSSETEVSDAVLAAAVSGAGYKIVP